VNTLESEVEEGNKTVWSGFILTKRKKKSSCGIIYSVRGGVAGGKTYWEGGAKEGRQRN